VLVIGQEQDSRGGQFSSSESYVGHVHSLNVWNYTLSLDEIQRLASSCGHLGNVMAWPDVLAGINGHVRRINTSFCAGRSIIVCSVSCTFTPSGLYRRPSRRVGRCELAITAASRSVGV